MTPAVCFVLMLPTLPAADTEKEARALLDRAIAALGGEKLLAKPHALTGTGKGKVTLLGGTQNVTNRWTVQGPDRMRWETELSGDVNASIVMGLTGTKLWISGNGGKPGPVPKETAEAFIKGFLALRIAEELVPLKAKGWKLTHLGELKVGDVTAVGLKATHAGRPDIDLFFDKKTHLPIKVEMRLKKPGESDEMTLTALLTGYKKIDGRQHFTGLVVEQDGKKALEMERSDIKAGDKADEATFEKP